jgi:hypothetical protein
MDIYTSDEFQKKANKQALILARTRYNELIAPFVKNSSERLEYAKNDIEKIVLAAVEQFDADANYVRNNLYATIVESARSDYNHHNEDADKIWWEEEGKHHRLNEPMDIDDIYEGRQFYDDPWDGECPKCGGQDYGSATLRDPMECFTCGYVDGTEPPREPIYGSKRTADSDNKRTMEKGLGVDGEAVKEDLSDAGKSYTGFGDGKSDAKDKGLGVDGDKGGEEATSEPKSESVNFDKNDAENEDAVEGFGGGPESPSSEVKDPSERPDESIEETDISYHNGPVLEKEIRGPSAGGPGKKHELKEDTFKWTKVEDRLIVSTKEDPCDGSCDGDCSCDKKKV